nr:hypothetical protein [Cupriavidus sp. KK10]
MAHGGFYAHFGSKDALIAEAIDAAFDQTMEFLEQAAQERHRWRLCEQEAAR